ncbi:MAG: hypothetical protein J6T27_00550 [Alphaproteobacteria bacterium]|nr:hypothetical protein [Alphaproteobacteria bacterium]
MKISIFQAMQICNNIKDLYQNKNTNKMIPWNWSDLYQITMPGFGTIIESHRIERHISTKEYIVTTFWTNLIGTGGQAAIIPTTFTVTFNNKGILPHAPNNQDLIIHGLPARLIFHTMKKEYLRDWHKAIGLRH